MLLDIGASLAEVRRVHGLSQRALGELVGVKQQQIARWEAAGYRGVSLERVNSVAEALGAPMPTEIAELAAEERAPYAAGVAPVRDLGEIVARIRANGERLRDRFTLVSLAVFGSFACGEQTPDSDVDMLGEVEVVSLDNTVGAELWLEELLGRNVDLGRPSQLRDEIRERVAREAVDVWHA